ncbi:hypothetical protein KSC_063520 [Ktedonobacter sp. SOSP1-52]|nr:hypothetical protein KSC_063520 [Ktedonobacter sp. SOSP1-52]
MIEAEIEGMAASGFEGLGVITSLASEGRLTLRDIKHELEGERGLSGTRFAAEERQAYGKQIVDGPNACYGRGLNEVIQSGEGHKGASEEVGVGLLVVFRHVSLHVGSRGTFSRGREMEDAEYNAMQFYNIMRYTFIVCPTGDGLSSKRGNIEEIE